MQIFHPKPIKNHQFNISEIYKTSDWSSRKSQTQKLQTFNTETK